MVPVECPRVRDRSLSERYLTWVGTTLALAFALAARTVGAQELEPFRATNLTPPVAVIGLPLWSRVPASTTFGITTEIANHYRLSERAGDALILDGETLRLRAYVEQPIGRRWSIAVDVPYIRKSGGGLGDLMDCWHSAFGLPDGSRNFRPADLLEFELRDPNGPFFRLDGSGAGLGDVQLGVARRIGAADRVAVRATVKLPTGSERLLAGSGEADFVLSALRVREGNLRGQPAAYFHGGAIIKPDQPRNVRFPVEDTALAAVLGGALTIRPRFGIKGQLDINSALYDSQLEEIGQTAVQATLGGWLRFGDSGLFEYAVSEDVHVSTTPDVVFFFNLSWRLE